MDAIRAFVRKTESNEEEEEEGLKHAPNQF
jgi:hypothetical protein